MLASRNTVGVERADATRPAGTVAAGDRRHRSSGLRAARGGWGRVKRFYWKAYEDNLTGLSAMVAYNILLSLLPVTLLALFVAGRVLQSDEVERNVLSDLRDLFPDTAESTLTDLLQGLRDFSTSLGIAALVASVWIGTSFWGALDTAFCRIYDVRCRSWLEQKRFALAMLIVALLFILATVVVPTVQGLLTATAEELPFGLSDVPGLLFAVTLAVGLLLLFGTLCVIYWAVPNTAVPWRAIWPGAALATLAIGIVDVAFPFYLSQISTIERLGTTLVFIVIVLLWFYVLAIIVLGGAVINALRMREVSGA
jgi:membrane protein